jgi:hypothetical protein
MANIVATRGWINTYQRHAILPKPTLFSLSHTHTLVAMKGGVYIEREREQVDDDNDETAAVWSFINTKYVCK